MSATEPSRVEVALGERSYRIDIGAGLLDDRAALADLLAGRSVLVLTDENVEPLYAARLEAGAGAAAAVLRRMVVAPGEQAKTLATFGAVVDELVAMGAQRDAVLITLGGGVVGDLGGFAAACYMRGIDFVQCPTTLLAQVDASVGGKTAVNHPRGKNLIGAFYQPRRVLVDVRTLDTLPAREYAAGIAETVKYGVLGDAAFFTWLEARAGALRSREASVLIEAVERACRAKADIVSRDEREQGLRALLNLGHTFGHAIETETGYRRFLHGEAVALGMCLATDLAVRLGRCPAPAAPRLRRLLRAFDLPVELPGDLDPEALWEHMQLDKKNRAGRVRLILPRAIGRCEIADDVTGGQVLRSLAGGAAELAQ